VIANNGDEIGTAVLAQALAWTSHRSGLNVISTIEFSLKPLIGDKWLHLGSRSAECGCGCLLFRQIDVIAGKFPYKYVFGQTHAACVRPMLLS